MRPLPSHLNYSSFRPRSWVLYAQGEALVEFRDKDISFAKMVLEKWAVLTLSVIVVISGIYFRKSGLIERLFVSDNAAAEKFAVGAGRVLVILWISFGALFIILVMARWCLPMSIVRISGGKMSVERPSRSKRLREFDLSDIVSVQTALGNPAFHSLLTHGVFLRDGSKITFLRCGDKPEAEWVLKLMEEAIAKELTGVTATAAVPIEP